MEDLLKDLREADQLLGPHWIDAGIVIPRRTSRRVVGDALPTYNGAQTMVNFMVRVQFSDTPDSLRSVRLQARRFASVLAVSISPFTITTPYFSSALRTDM